MSHETKGVNEEGQEVALPRPEIAHKSLFYHLYRCESCGNKAHGHAHGVQRAIHSKDAQPPEVACPFCGKPMAHSLTHYADAGAVDDKPESYAVKREGKKS